LEEYWKHGVCRRIVDWIPTSVAWSAWIGRWGAANESQNREADDKVEEELIVPILLRTYEILDPEE
jgi:hypothetical protein